MHTFTHEQYFKTKDEIPARNVKFNVEHEGLLRFGGYVVGGVQGKVPLLDKVTLLCTLICP